MPKGEMTHRRRTSTTQPPGNPSKRLYRVIGLVRWRCGCGRIKIKPTELKIERLNDKTTQNGETTYHGCAQAAQPCINAPRRRYGVHRPRHQRGCIKTVPENVNRMEEVESAYLGCTGATLPCGNPLKGCLEVHRWRRQRGRVKIKSVNAKIKRLNDNKAQNGKTTYLGCMGIPQSPANTLKRPYGDVKCQW